MCTLCQSLNPLLQTTDLHVNSLGGGTIDAVYDQSGADQENAGLPVFSLDQIADYLTAGYWAESGRGQRSFNVTTGGTITYNINGLDTLGKETALKALEAWSAASGVNFVASSGAQLTFDDNQSGAYASSSTIGGTIVSSTINVHGSWQAYGDYYLQTYIHEVGHALGLGHSGNYNGSASYSRDAHYANDSWQTTVMSYFDQNQNTYTNASRVFVASAQIADILAIQNLYGTPTSVRTGDTVYGDGHNTGQHGMDLDARWAVAVQDNGGTDLINLAARASHQVLNLNAETFSDLNGKIGNFAIARGTVIENAVTGSGNDRITGNAVANMIASGAGNDVVSGMGGNDLITGGAGADTLSGGTGADRFIYLGTGDAGDTITDLSLAQGDRVDVRAVLSAIGYVGNDPVADGILSLEADSGGSWLLVDPDGAGGAAGIRLVFLADIDAGTSVAELTDTSGEPPVDPDPVPGDTYDDTYQFTNSFVTGWTVQRGTITDTDGGTDTLDLSAVTYASRIFLTSGLAGKLGTKGLTIATGSVIENLLLGRGSDTGTGNAVANLIDGGLGNDKLYGLDGDDTLIGGIGSDGLYGGDGSDALDGGIGNDKLYGGTGDDTLVGGDGTDSLYGEAGNDAMDGGAGNDKLYGAEGDDTIAGGDGNDYLRGDAGDDMMAGGAGNDKLYGNDGNDTLTGDDGHDYLRGDAGDDVMAGGVGNDKLYGNDGDDSLSGDDGNDYLRGDAGDDVMAGGVGNDKLYGNDGDDSLSGDDGNDYLRGDAGDDVMEGGAGNDNLYGSDGDDTLRGGAGLDYLKGDHGDDLLEGGADNDKLYGGVGADTLIGDDGDDYLKGDSDGDVLEGSAGNDRLYGDAGDDVLRGGEGNDYLKAGNDDDQLEGGAGDDVLLGDAGDDLLMGGEGSDLLNGGTGDDTLWGGTGADRLTGGSGADCFVFAALDEAGAMITDFSIRNGDVIDVSGILDGLGLTSGQAIAGGVLSLSGDRSGSWLMVDADGAGGAEAVQMAYLSRIAQTTELDDSWII